MLGFYRKISGGIYKEASTATVRNIQGNDGALYVRRLRNRVERL